MLAALESVLRTEIHQMFSFWGYFEVINYQRGVQKYRIAN